MEHTMHARCGQKLKVTQKNDGFYMLEACQGGHGPNMPVGELYNACGNCPVVVTPAVIKPAEAILEVAQPHVVEEIHAPVFKLDFDAMLPAAAVQPTTVNRTELKADAELPPLESLILPGGLTLGMPAGTEDTVDVDAVLTAMPGYVGGPSSGGLSSHTLGSGVCWRRVWNAHVLGREPLVRSRSLAFGSLFHAVCAMRYLYGEQRQWEPCDLVAQAGAPQLAAQVKRLLSVQFQKYALEEWKTWCPRAIEHNLIAWLPVKVEKKTIPVPLCCRVDLILALKKEHENHPGPGPVPQGVFLLDWKSTSRITYDLVEGYGMDFQFLLQCAIYKLSGAERDFGPLRGVMVSLASKDRKSATFDSFQRIEAPMSRGVIDEFIEFELKPTVAEFYHRIACPELRAAGAIAWPKDRRQCIGRWGRCEFFDLCDRGAEGSYRTNTKRILVAEEFARPPAGWKAQGDSVEEPSATSTGKAKPKVKELTPEEAEGIKLFASAILYGAENDPQYASLARDKFLTPGHTMEGVIKLFTEALKNFYATAAQQGVHFAMGGRDWQFSKSGVSWALPDKKKGRITWKQTSEWICKNVWFDPSQALAIGPNEEV